MKHSFRVAAVLSAVALFGVACGSDSDSGSDTTAAAAETTAAPETSAGGDTTTTGGDTTAPAAPAGDTPCVVSGDGEASGEAIKVGSIQGKTGPDDFSSSGQGAKAFFECVNANGGINGRPVEFILGDDEWTPEKAAQLGGKMVNDDEVVAFVGSSSFVECGANAKLYEDNNVVAVYGTGVPRECFFSKNISPTNSGPRISALGAAEYLKAAYDTKSLVCISQNIPNTGEWVCKGVEDWGAENGIEVRTILHDPANLDATTVVQDAMSTDPDGVIVMEPAGLAIAIYKAAEEQDLGDATHWSGPTSQYDADFPAAIGDYWNERLDVQIELNEINSTGADNQAWLQTMDEYGNSEDPRDTFSQAGWLAAKIFTETLMAMPSDGITREAVTEALVGVKNFESDLMCTPWYFGPGDRHNANHDGRVVQVSGGGYKLVQDCAPVNDPEIGPVLDLETSEGLVG